MSKITAFVACSFSPEDKGKIQPIMAFLESFRPLGFVCDTAEPAEVESVSKKVREMIDASDVFVGIFTRRHPIYPVPAGLKAAFDVLRRQFRVTARAASARQVVGVMPHSRGGDFDARKGGELAFRTKD